jgi:hypothetical protein
MYGNYVRILLLLEILGLEVLLYFIEIQFSVTLQCVCMGEMRNAYVILVGNPEGKRPSGGPKRKWEDSIRVDLREIGWEGVDWMHLVQESDQWQARVNTVMNLRIP